MSVYINLDTIIKEKGYTSKQLAEEIGITNANLSRLKNGYVSEIKLDTLCKICKVLKCEPGDIIKYKELDKPRIIPLFLDYSGTTDLLLEGGVENVKGFFDSIISMQKNFNCEIQITMVTGSSYSSAKSKFELLVSLAKSYKLPNLFNGVISEYCGFWIKQNEAKKLLTLDTRILERKREIKLIAEQNGGKIEEGYTSIINVFFEEANRTLLARTASKIEKLFEKDEDIQLRLYCDKYGTELDVKPDIHSKAEAIYMIIKELMKDNEILFVIIGGDSQEEDLEMYTLNKERIEELDLKTFFIAPYSIEKFMNVNEDKNIIMGDWENYRGITECINKLNKIYGGKNQ